jgi:DNA mismatch endonuclease (patch repair protein)
MSKFHATVERDKRKAVELSGMGWRVVTVWECDLERDPKAAIAMVSRALEGGV